MNSDKIKLYSSVLLITTALGLFVIGNTSLFNNSPIETSVAGVYLDQVGNISYGFDVPTNRFVYRKNDIPSIQFSVSLPQNFNNYFNQGEEPILSHSLILVSPSFKTYEFQYERNLSTFPSNSYKIQLEDFLSDLNIFESESGNWNLRFHLNDNNGNRIGPEISRLFNIRIFPVNLFIENITGGIRLFWETANYAINEIDDTSSGNSAFTKEVNIRVYTGEVENADNFPISNSITIPVLDTYFERGAQNLFFDTNKNHSFIVTINTNNKLYYSQVGEYKSPLNTSSSNAGGQSDFLRQVQQLINQSPQEDMPQVPATSESTNTTSSPDTSTPPSEPQQQSSTTSQNLPINGKGDFNNNGILDVEDFVILSNYINLDGNFSTFIIVLNSVGIDFSLSNLEFLTKADINNDGSINSGDLNLLYLQS